MVKSLTSPSTLAAVAGGAAMLGTTALAVPKIFEKANAEGKPPSPLTVALTNVGLSVAGFVAARMLKAPNVAIGALAGGVGGTLASWGIAAYRKAQAEKGTRGLGNAGRQYVVDRDGNLYPLAGLGDREVLALTQGNDMSGRTWSRESQYQA